MDAGFRFLVLIRTETELTSVSSTQLKLGSSTVFITSLLDCPEPSGAHLRRCEGMDAACFREWARLMEGKSDHLLEDAMIAATARVHALKVASRNENDFDHFRVDLVNPFKHHS